MGISEIIYRDCRALTRTTRGAAAAAITVTTLQRHVPRGRGVSRLAQVTAEEAPVPARREKAKTSFRRCHLPRLGRDEHCCNLPYRPYFCALPPKSAQIAGMVVAAEMPEFPKALPAKFARPYRTLRRRRCAHGLAILDKCRTANN